MDTCLFYRWIPRYGILAVAALVLFGCSGAPGRIAPPSVDPDDAAAAALELYDKNADARLDGAELRACPPLLDALPTYDSDGDGEITKTELVVGLRSWAKRGIGAMAVPFTVRLDGKPLSGAEVKLTPVAFLEGTIMPAAGVANERGAGSLKMSSENRPANVPKHLPVLQPGLYSVEITHPSIDIPPQYNSETVLGLEAGVAGQNPSGVVWDLRSKKKK